jgi:mandelamide amidase
VGESQTDTAIDLAAAHVRRSEAIETWRAWFDEHEVTAVIEPTVPVVGWPRGDGYDRWGSDRALISLTSYWNWTGLPAVAIPSGLGAETGLPTGVSLIGNWLTDWELLGRGIALQAELGVPEAPFPTPATARKAGG